MSLTIQKTFSAIFLTLMSVAFVIAESPESPTTGSLRSLNRSENRSENLSASTGSIAKAPAAETQTAALNIFEESLFKESLSEESIVRFYSCMLPTGWASDSFLPVDLPVDKSDCNESNA